jgi:hypothetical protein
VLLLLHTACLGALLPEELEVGEEISAVAIAGEPLSQLGAAVAVGEDAGEPLIVVGAPGAGEVIAFRRDGAEAWRVSGEVGLGRRVWADGASVFLWLPQVGVLDPAGDLVHSAPQATALTRCPDGTWWGSNGIGDAVDCSGDGLLRSTCSGGECQVSVASIPGGEATVLGETSAGSAVGWIDGVACWGDAALEADPSPGRLRCEDGTELVGLDGDHLGASIGAGRTAGVFNKWQVPARLRIASLSDGEVWTIDRAAERSRVALAEGQGIVVIGVPGFISQHANEGHVFLVSP